MTSAHKTLCADKECNVHLALTELESKWPTLSGSDETLGKRDGGGFAD